MQRKSIARKFMYLYLIVAVSSLSFMGFYSYFKSKNALLSRAIEQLNSVRSIKKAQIENYFNFLKVNKLQPDFDTVSEILLDTNQTKGLGRSGDIYIVNDDFRIISKSRFPGYLREGKQIRTKGIIQAFASGEGHSINPDYRNILCLSSFDKLNIEGHNWVIVAEIDYSEAMSPIKNLRNDLIFISIIILLLILSIAQVITTDILLPIREMKNAAIGIGKGDFSSRVNFQSSNEFGLLATAFNQMIENIERNTAELVDERTKRITALFDGQEQERHRISLDLHDGLAQQLIAIRMTLNNLIDRKELNNEAKLSNLKQQITDAIDELRKISYDLAPAGLLEFSIENALANLVNQISQNSSIEIDFSAFGDFSGINQRTKIYLYRIVQEAIANTIKHAEATQLLIQLTETTTHYVLIIEDNGKGFEFNRNNLGLGKGLFNMQERSILLNGTFDVESIRDEGTTIRVKINKVQ
jgi:signal transduction histidine kinase